MSMLNNFGLKCILGFKLRPSCCQFMYERLILSRKNSTYVEEKERDHLLQFKGGSVDLHQNDDDGIAVVTLNHPQRKNALSGAMMVDLRDVVDKLASWKSGKGVILHGNGNTFCSGGDLTLMKNLMDPILGGNMSRYMQETMFKFYSLPLFSIALIEGQALGGGAELTVSCDVRLSTPSAKIGFVQARMGVSPGWGGGVKLVDHIGRKEAVKMLCSGKVYTAQDAQRIGLVDEILPESGDALELSKTWLLEHVRGSPHVTQVAKKVVLAACMDHLKDVMDRERELFKQVWGGKDHNAAMVGKIKHK